MNFGMNKGSQQSQSSSNVGLRGTDYESGTAANAYNQGSKLTELTNHFTNLQDPGAFLNFGKMMLPGGKYGLGENADAGVMQFGSDMFNKFSGSGASRGQLSPENQSGVIGSAIQNSLGTLIPQMQQMQLAQFMAPQNLLQTAKTSAEFWNKALGASSESSGGGSNFGFGFGVGGGNETGQGIGMFM